MSPTPCRTRCISLLLIPALCALFMSSGCAAYLARRGSPLARQFAQEPKPMAPTPIFGGTTLDLQIIGESAFSPITAMFNERVAWFEFLFVPFVLVDTPLSLVADFYWMPYDIRNWPTWTARERERAEQLSYQYSVSVVNDGKETIFVDAFEIGPNEIAGAGILPPGVDKSIASYTAKPNEIVIMTWTANPVAGPRGEFTGRHVMVPVALQLPEEFKPRSDAEIIFHIVPEEEKVTVTYEIKNPETGGRRVITE